MGFYLVRPLVMAREDGKHRACLALVSQPLRWLEERAAEFLHPGECKQLAGYRFERRRTSFLLGRHAAKEAIAGLMGNCEKRSFEVKAGVFGQPLVYGNGLGGIGVSLSHSSEHGAAIAFERGHPMGIDLEENRADRIEALRSQVDPSETALARAHVGTELEQLAMFWTAKEALSKVLGTGLMAPFRLFCVSAVRLELGWVTSEFRDFPQYKAMSLLLGGHWLSVVLPRKTDMGLEAEEIRRGWKRARVL